MKVRFEPDTHKKEGLLYTKILMVAEMILFLSHLHGFQFLYNRMKDRKTATNT